MKIGITGANSAVGQLLLAKIAETDDLAAVACVRSEEAARSLPTSPRIEARIVDYGNVSDLAEALKGCATVIHLAGVLIEKKGSPYKTANEGATRAVAEAADRVDAVHFIFVSALGADPESDNAYLRSKGASEEIVKSAKAAASIIRTPILLGEGTAGTQALVAAASQARPRLLGGGRHMLQPLDADDLATAILRLSRKTPGGTATYELGGPERLSYADLVARMAAIAGNTPDVREVPVRLAKLGAAIQRALTGSGMSSDVIDVITSDEEIHGNSDRELGVTVTPLDRTLMRSRAARATEARAESTPKGSGTFSRVAFFLIAVACFAYLYVRLDGAAAREGLSLAAYMTVIFSGVEWTAWLVLMAGYSALYFLIDTFVVWRVINWFIAEVSYTNILPIRASAYIISIFNEQVGKGAMAVYLNRRDGVPGWEVGSAMLFIMFCEYFYLLFWATLGYGISSAALPEVFALIPMLAAASAVFLVLWVLYFGGTIFPSSKLKESRILHAFRLATPKHYLGFLLMRSPAILAAVVVYTTALGLFGVSAGYGELLGYLPVIFFAAAIPTPMRAAAITGWVILFPENAGQMAAFGLVQHNFFILFNAVIGLIFLRRAQRELLTG